MEREGSDWIPFNGLIPPHFCAYTKTKPVFPARYIYAVVNCMWNDL